MEGNNMEELQKFMTVTGEGGPCIIYPQHMKEKNELREATKNEIFSSVLKPFYDIENIASINNILQGVLNGGDFLAGVDSLLNKSQGSNLSTNNLTINTYPFGVKTDEIFHDFFAICRTPTKLSDVFEKISDWCKKSGAKYPKGESKHVLLITDQWNPADFQPYEDNFRERAMHEDFWFIFILVTHNAMYDISFLPHEFYKFTRHIADAQPIGNINVKDKSTVILPFEGLAEVNILADGNKSLHFIVEEGEEKYCVTAGSYRGNDKTIETAIAIGKWDCKRKAYSALVQDLIPFGVRLSQKTKDAEIVATVKRARSCVTELSKNQSADALFEAYRKKSKRF